MSFDRHPYLKHSPAMPAHKDTQHPAGQVVNTPHEKLSDYIRSINRAQAFDDVAQEKKLTFDEWYPENKNKIEYNYDTALLVWNAALTRGTLS
jgi:hypothetical protein